MPSGPFRRVAFATSAALPEGTPDDRLALTELQRAGIEAVPAIWSSPEVDWESFERVIVRSTWDYYRHGPEFLRWAERVAGLSELQNPLPIVRWNSHKGYLVELAGRGYEVVPTRLERQGSRRSLAEILIAEGWSDGAVIKPAVSASGEGLVVMPAGRAAAYESNFRKLLGEGDTLVQPHLPDGPVRGERSMVFLGGTFSHAAQYPYLLLEGVEHVRRPSPWTPTSAALDGAQRLIDDLPSVPLYARIDYMPGPGGGWLIGELELIEPELLLAAHPEAASRFARAIAARR